MKLNGQEAAQPPAAAVTPPNRVRKAPRTPTSTPARGSSRSTAPSSSCAKTVEIEDSADDGEPSEGCKKNRLRCICERKPSGRLHVPKEIHEKWLKGGTDRDELMELLARCDWKRDRVANIEANMSSI